MATNQQEQHIETKEVTVMLPNLTTLTQKSLASFSIEHPDAYFE
jgi:hypothetical protein